MPDMSNQSVAEVLRQIGEYLEMQHVQFKPRAFEKAAETVGALEEEVSAMYAKGGIKALKEIPGVGQSIAEIIEELVTKGRSTEYEKLKKATPVRLDELARVEGLGPKSIQKLYKELGIKNLKDLEAAAKKGKIGALEGFGKKSEEKILKGIEFAKGSGLRFIGGLVMPQIREIEKRLGDVPGVSKVTVAGSSRRRKETIGDIDILAVSSKPEAVMEAFVKHTPGIMTVIAHGATKSSIKIRPGINVDLRVVSAESYGSALNYFTGSKEHNVVIRARANKMGLTLNEYGLFKIGKGGKKIGSALEGNGERVAGRTEEEIYKALRMAYPEPEIRENTGEVEAAAREFEGKKPGLPKLIGYGDLLGDLQTQTNWTDGDDSIEVMARAAAARGLEYIVITDHTKRLAMAHGLDEKRIREQWKEVDAVNKKLRGKIKILKGTECDILKDGTLDLDDETLARLDVVGVSVHSFFNLTRADQTARIKRAMENPNVDILFHPTGRLINKRAPYDVDMDELIATAKKTGTVMEIDALPERSDLKDENIRKCVEAGVKMSIDSDAHAASHFGFLECGIAQARRGWAERDDIINTRPLEKMLACLKKK
ncbi:MAG TPA: DNA polymerase/3'-5' exonuclease PolX [Candidatus Paceibacterota bacterium]|nr:DNA polymerase/3'-5' exonuclease PolX [Candidatus Paceibacterota bacterium]